jgi:hypothetical protein
MRVHGQYVNSEALKSHEHSLRNSFGQTSQQNQFPFSGKNLDLASGLQNMISR